MKALKYILLFLFVITLLGILGKSTEIFPANGLLMLSIFLYLITGVIYGLLALVKKKQRIEAGMIAIAGPLVFGLLLYHLRWRGAGEFIVSGTLALFIGSIAIFIYTIRKKRKSTLGMLYLAIGISSLLFFVKFMRWEILTRWDTAYLLLIPTCAAIIFAIIFWIKNEFKITFSKVVSLIILFLILTTFFSKESQLFRFKNISIKQPHYNHPMAYHLYAWILYKEGDKDKAKESLQIAINMSKDSQYIDSHHLLDVDKNYIERYEKDIELLISDKWNEPNYKKYYY